MKNILDAFKKEIIEKESKNILNLDKSWGTIYTTPHPISKMGYLMGINKNMMYKSLYNYLEEIENYIVNWYLQLFNSKKIHSNNNNLGYVTLGGTISNMLACYIGKLRCGSEKRNEIIVPEHSHFSIKKIVKLLNLKVIKIKISDDLKVNYYDIKKAITEKTFMIFSTFGTTAVGEIDPIIKLSNLSREKNIYLHVDAAYGGMLYPFMNNIPKWDYRLPGIDSISVCPHKLGRTVLGSSVITFKNSSYMDLLIHSFKEKKVSMVIDTFEGSRSAGNIVGTYGMLKYYGLKRYKKDIMKIIKISGYIRERLLNSGRFEVLNTSIENNIVFFKVKDKFGGLKITQFLLKELKKRGFFLYGIYGGLRIFTNHHHSISSADILLNNIFDIFKMINKN